MYDFLLQITLFSSFGVIVYVMARAVPRVNDAGEPVHTKGVIDRMLSRLPLEVADERLHTAFEKILRRIRVTVLRVDNSINERLEKLRKKSGKNGAMEANAHLFEKVSEKDTDK